MKICKKALALAAAAFAAMTLALPVAAYASDDTITLTQENFNASSSKCYTISRGGDL